MEMRMRIVDIACGCGDGFTDLLPCPCVGSVNMLDADALCARRAKYSRHVGKHAGM